MKDVEEEAFLTHVRRTTEPHRVITEINTEIGDALGNLTSGIRTQSASLGFASESLLDVARDLRFRLADAGLTPEEIRSSGLGYANLLYMATVAVELSRAREADLTLFLVEEPEAHLHPQLQMLVLDFLLSRARDSARSTPSPGQPRPDTSYCYNPFPKSDRMGFTKASRGNSIRVGRYRNPADSTDSINPYCRT
jgi:putative ATP-dependent endonuclease of OLD family